MAKKLNIKEKGKPQKNNGVKPLKNFQLLKAIQGKPQKNNEGEASLYKANVERRDTTARKFLNENINTDTSKPIFPGQLVMFDYFEPATKEELEYYDAMPCTIFFGNINTKNGVRVLGFNIHYYPPKMRFQIMDRIFDIFKPIYLESWNDKLDKQLSYFNYKMLIDQLQKAKLEFGIRLYIPKLMATIKPIPPKYWQKAVFTEGRFKKRTREMIMNYWKNYKSK